MKPVLFRKLGVKIKMIILIYNRGEIACRILRTCQKLGIQTVGIYTPEDQFSSHIKETDFKIELPPGDLSLNYLNVDFIIEKSLKLNVTAVHPGYGFVSESAEACLKFENAGIIWIGPSATNIVDFSSKHISKNIAKSCGVPITDYAIVESVESCLKESEIVGYPVILKLSSGGGGIGMYRCKNKSDVLKYFPLVELKTKSVFKDSKILIEKFLSNCHHIEIQIIGDGNGHVISLAERECSIQRRNQKLIEEAPSPFLSQETRQKMCSDAIKLAQFVSYRSVGTVEFLVDDSKPNEYFFLEVNARLQVEHAVTEMLFDVDLVEIMIKLACFSVPKISLKNIRQNKGHSIEVRIYAEDCLNSFMPSCGQLTHVYFAQDNVNTRIETWIENGTVISPLYDPLLAKVICFAQTREKCLKKLLKCLKKTVIQGVNTNLEFLTEVLKHELFIKGKTLTSFLNNFSYDSYTAQVLEPGMYSTIQDYPGRVGYWNIGIPPSGPMDNRNFRIANYLVENDFKAAGIEILHDCLVLKFNCNSLIAVTGASAQVKINNTSFNMYESIFVPKNGILEIRLDNKQSNFAGCRVYLAIQGGCQTMPYLGSRSTFPSGNFGGLNGTTLKMFDTIPLSKNIIKTNFLKWPPQFKPTLSNTWEVFALAGPHSEPDYFTKEDIINLWSSWYEINHNSNRLGIRLETVWKPTWSRKSGGDAGFHPSNVHDYAYSINSVNFSGNTPIILTVDGPSLGGFVCPLTIIQSESWKIGQFKPGDKVRFVQVDYNYAIESLKLESHLLNGKFNECCVLKTPQIDPCNSINPVFNIRMPNLKEPKVLFRLSGDQHVLVEFELNEFEIENRFYIQVILNKLKHLNYEYVLEMVPGVSTLLVKCNPFLISANQLADLITKLIPNSKDVNEMKIACRSVRLPLAFHDYWSLQAISRYMKTICNNAPYLPDNCNFVQSLNGFKSLEDLTSILVDTTYIVLGLGDVYLGAPLAVPYDPRHRIITTKYNPARTFTPEGAVGIGGIYMCIYGMESPGGYQLIGRTLPIWNTYSSKPWLFDFFDMIKFYLVNDNELIHIREEYKLGKFTLNFENVSIALSDYRRFCEHNQLSILRYKESHNLTRIATQINWSIFSNKESTVLNENQEDEGDSNQEADNSLSAYFLIKSDQYGCVYEIKVKEDDVIKKDDPIMLIELMKMSIAIKSPVDAKINKILVRTGQVVKPPTHTDEVMNKTYRALFTLVDAINNDDDLDWSCVQKVNNSIDSSIEILADNNASVPTASKEDLINIKTQHN
ncbi:uncharacterized protein LOC124806726 isoform X1 [Hydra vulgaris]|uniref:uncharacterized protein LOC124806726 isoform X1 n=1 Tax=Hydra vulgaris TaxID=6087 RepID=UPI0032EA60E7